MGTSRNTGSDKQTYYKLSLCGDEGDSVREMAKTLHAGGGVMGEHALCEAAYSARAFLHLVELGVPFPTNEFGEYAGYKTDHDPRSRATSCGPLTSKYMTEALEQAVAEKNVPLLDHLRVIRILTDENGVTGVACVSTLSGEVSVFQCNHVILATGGPALVYQNSVYPESQSGATGLAIEAGAEIANGEEWQYGIASTSFRWNLSGSYQQVLPRYVSVDEKGIEREFLYDALGEESLGLIFLKGYQWPFDTAKLTASSQIDLLVAREIKLGRKVYLDFRQNPKGLEQGFKILPEEAFRYLSKSKILFGTPIERLKKMNLGAFCLYEDHGIDLGSQLLPIAVCAQHCNGGVAVDAHWQSTVDGLYAVGEAAGTFGVYRPGGSALNSTQVGSLRAAEHIAARMPRHPSEPSYSLPLLRKGPSNVAKTLRSVQKEMSQWADFDRNLAKMEELVKKLRHLRDHFFEILQVESAREHADLFRLYDTVVTQCTLLSAMIYSGKELGSHGSALVDGQNPKASAPRNHRTVTKKDCSEFQPITPLPNPELWFETLLAQSDALSQKKGET